MNQKSTHLLKKWISSSFIKEKDKLEIQKYTKKEQIERFEKIIQFKNSGWRAKIGLGSDQFNQYNIKIIILALIDYLKKEEINLENNKILVLRDQRKESKKTAKSIQKILSNFNLNVEFYNENEITPTPFLSYILKNNKDYFLGIMITASHNKKEINGLKFFQKNGVIFYKTENQKINDLIKKNYDKYLNTKIIEKEIKNYSIKIKKEDYLKMLLKSKWLNSEEKTKEKTNTIWYSSLHGTGINWTDLVLKRAGFKIQLIEKQCQIDSNFSNVSDPNPENNKTFQKVFQEIKVQPKLNDLILINDADGDRVRLAFYDKTWNILNGNEIATIIAFYLLQEKNKKGKFFRSHVSTQLIDIICKDFQREIIVTDTGFGNLAHLYQNYQDEETCFSFEESIGYLIDRSINNDKDGIQTALLLANINNFLNNKKKTFKIYLNEIYKKYFYFAYKTKKISLIGIDLENEIKKLKENTPFNKTKIIKIDYFSESKLYQIIFANQIKISYRTSQTEPIGKIYFISWDKKDQAEIKMEEMINFWKKYFKIDYKIN